MSTVTTRSVRRVAQKMNGDILGHKRGEKRKRPIATKRRTKGRLA